MNTQNVTLSLPKEVLRKAKMIAIQRRTSLSRLLTRALEDMVARRRQKRRY
jgi:predicted transcriptional regulator